MRVLTARDDAVLIECGDLDEALALLEAFRAARLPGLGELVPGARTLLVPFRPARITAAHIAEAARGMVLDRRRVARPRRVELPTRYDGEDLADVARLLDMTADELVRRHTNAAYRVGFMGFAPGFAYLTGDDPTLVVPRHATPRTRIPAGAVALADAYCGVHPRESPGGWQLIGTTQVPMWDLDRDPPATLAPGDTVVFRPVDEHARPVVSAAAPRALASTSNGGVSSTSEHEQRGGLTVVAPGPLTLVQDLGRAGSAHLGVSASGAADAPALRRANRLVGNDPAAAGLEVTAGGLRVRCSGPQVVAVTGAELAVTVHGPLQRSVDFGGAIALDDGEELELGRPSAGLRSYLAVRGGLAVPKVLGSAARDVLAGLGPEPVRAGDELRVRAPRSRFAAARARSDATSGRLPRADGSATELRIVLGPRHEQFSASSLERLAEQCWLVTAESNRVGIRLAGEPLARRTDAELPSEGCVTGALQVPPDGQPVLFLADHPVTGGYPVVGAVISEDVPLAAQLPPGSQLRFRVVDPITLAPAPAPDPAPTAGPDQHGGPHRRARRPGAQQ